MRPATGATNLLFLMANKQLHIDRAPVIDAPAHADGGRPASEHHARKSDILRDHDIARLQPLDDGEICTIGADTHVEHVDPKSVVRGIAPACVLWARWVVAPNVTREILRGVARNHHGHTNAPRAIERFARDRAGVGIDKERAHGSASFFSV